MPNFDRILLKQVYRQSLFEFFFQEDTREFLCFYTFFDSFLVLEDGQKIVQIVDRISTNIVMPNQTGWQPLAFLIFIL